MPKTTETIMQEALRKRMEEVRKNRSALLSTLVTDLLQSPGPLGAEAAACLADFEKITDDQLDDNDAYMALYDRVKALNLGAHMTVQREATFQGHRR